jgi:hypothetical protein
LVNPPPVAVRVTVKVPADFVVAADSVKMLLPLPGAAMLDGENAAVIPLGTPLIENATAELNPFAPAVVRLIRVELPGVTLVLVTPLTLDVSVKVGVNTVRLRV